GVSIPLPNGRTVLETAEPIGGAITNFSRSLRINPLLRDAYLFLGNLYLRNVQKYRDPGILLFQHALRYYPEDREFWLNLGYLQVQSQQLEQAYLSLKNALILDPFYELTRRNIRALLLQLKREKDPLLEADQILNQTNQWIQTKSWKELRSAYERLFHLLPPHFQFHLILANAYYELKEWEKAEKEYQKALKIDSRNLTALNNLALTYRQTGKIAEAKKIYEEMLILNPNDTNIRAQLQIL
ncbi:MAG: tetratricopeptide repeat protein, partial [Elusimicrobia bacterium]|nr:tetratricopeptide repeat protein [Elusimicrobiota bacterium]